MDNFLARELAANPDKVALVQTALMLPIMIVAMPAGAIADMYDRRKVALASLTLSLAGSTTLATLAHLGRVLGDLGQASRDALGEDSGLNFCGFRIGFLRQRLSDGAGKRREGHESPSERRKLKKWPNHQRPDAPSAQATRALPTGFVRRTP